MPARHVMFFFGCTCSFCEHVGADICKQAYHFVNRIPPTKNPMGMT